MRLIQTLVITTWIILFIVCAGCVGTGGSEVGNPIGLSLRIVGVEENAPPTGSLSVRGGITIDEALITLSRIRFRLFDQCLVESEDENIDFDGPFVVDLLTSTSLPTLDQITVASGIYCRLELRFHKLDDSERPEGIGPGAEIVDRSIVIRGRRTDNTPFVIYADENDAFRLNNEVTGFNLNANNQGAVGIFLAFFLGEWFNGIDLASATVSGPEIIIDKDNNEALFDRFLDNIKESSRLYRDNDFNGSLDPEERESGDELAVGEEVSGS